MVTDEYIIGVCAFTHDSSAALFRGRELLGFLEEDRLSGQKHTNEFPSTAIELLLHAAGVRPSDVGAVAYTFDSRLYPLGREAARIRTGPASRRADAVASYDRVAAQHQRSLQELADVFTNADVVEIPHHEAHAFSALAPAGWREADVLVIDSIGEASTTSTGHWDPIAKVLTLRSHGLDTDSAGYLYGAVTDHLGFRMRDEEGTVMALAGEGDPAPYRALFARILRVDEKGLHLDSHYVRQRVFGDRGGRLTEEFERETAPRRQPGTEILAVHADIAAALQERISELFEYLCSAGSSLLRVISGGVATNCVAIGHLRQRWPDVEFFVPPAPGDSGTSVGAAAACLLLRHGELALVPPRPYWGPEPELPKQDEDVKERFRFAALGTLALANECAKRLAEGQIVGVFRGGAEAGPRALGRRSIFADPRVEGIHHRLALQVKKRELFRPFAPIVRLADAHRYVEHGGYGSPYMSAALRARPELVDLAPVVVHSNGTARMQTLSPGAEPFTEALLAEFHRITGSPILINTSLNPKGSPTVGTWQDALECLSAMDLDAVVLGDELVTRS